MREKVQIWSSGDWKSVSTRLFLESKDQKILQLAANSVACVARAPAGVFVGFDVNCMKIKKERKSILYDFCDDLQYVRECFS